MDPLSPNAKLSQCPECTYQSKHRNLSRHITRRHSTPKNTDLIPVYERVPTNSNTIFTSKFQATAVLDALDKQDRKTTSIDLQTLGFKESIQILREQIHQLSQSHRTTIDNLTMRIESLEESNARLVKSQSKLVHKLRSLKKNKLSAPTAAIDLEEVKSKRVHRQRSRVKRFARSNLLKSKQVVKEGHK